MEELKILVGMVADLPQMALWVVALFFAYKVTIVGSIFGVLRLLILKVHSWATTPRENVVTEVRDSDVDRLTIRDAYPELINQIERIRGIGVRDRSSRYVHVRDVEWLRDAISEKLVRDAEREQ
jgi:hypothetical protein